MYLCFIASGEGPPWKDTPGGPTVSREFQYAPETTLTEEQCREAIALMKHSTDEETVKKKMKLTFPHRRKLVLDPHQSSNILSAFPRFRDVKGLVIIIFQFLGNILYKVTVTTTINCLLSPLSQIEQDFILMFGETASMKLLERWQTTFKQKIIQQCWKLPGLNEMKELLLAADPPEDGPEADLDSGRFVMECCSMLY